ncbi:MAG: TolC family protein [Acidobacteria bacterium]|nr:TolC family protein [Acidobacteriota bacterium]
MGTRRGKFAVSVLSVLWLHNLFLAASPQDKPALTVNEAVALAVTRNQQALIARAQVDLMRGKVREVRAEALPFISFTSSSLRLRDPSFLNASSFDTIPIEFREGLRPRGANLFDYSFKVSQPLYSSGKVASGLKLASLEMEGTGIDQARVEQEIRLRAVRAFYDLVLAEKLLEVSREMVQQRQRHLELARVRYEAGVATEVDVLRSQVSLANAQPELLRAENAVHHARSVLNNLLVRPVDFPTETLGQLDFVPWTRTKREEIVRDALAQRPELRRLHINELESDMQTKLAQAESRLRVDFVGEYGLSARDPSNLVDAHFTRWAFSLKLSLPIFDGGKRDGLLQQALAQRKVAELTLSAQEEAIRLEAQSALDELARAEKTIEAARLNVTQAERVLEMMQNNYKYGAATTLDVLDSQTAVTTARWTLYQGLHDHTVARAQVRYIMGQDPLEQNGANANSSK